MSVYPIALLLAAAAAKPDVAADLATLQKEVAAQRQLLNALLQDEQKQTSTLLRLLEQKGGSAPAFEPVQPEAPAARPTAPTVEKKAPRPAPPRPSGPRFTVTGKVQVKDGKLPANAWVFVKDVTGMARNKALEIAQQNKTFVPNVMVVQVGTRLSFPNFDAIFHDVFSRSPGNSFDIGASQGGEKARSILLYRPGLVEVFCNFHARMNAKVLVVPGPLYTQVDSDGRFTLANVPAGRHTIGAWAPGSSETTLTIDVSGPTELDLELIPTPSRAHLNKHGQVYGSYAD